MDIQPNEVDPIEIDHCQDFGAEYISSNLKSRSTQTLGWDEDFLGLKYAVKEENIMTADGYSYIDTWTHLPSIIGAVSSPSPAPISPHSYAGVHKVIPADSTEQQWATDTSGHVMLVQTSSPHSPVNTKGGRKYEKVYPKPVYSYSCLITMALKSSKDKKMPVSEIYHYMQTQFPYFRHAPEGWKNSVRHNLSLNKAFFKLDKSDRGFSPNKKGCYWLLNPEKVPAMDNEIIKWKRKHPEAIQSSMLNAEDFWNPPNHGIGPPPAHIVKRESYQPYRKELPLNKEMSLNNTLPSFEDKENEYPGDVDNSWVETQDTALFS